MSLGGCLPQKSAAVARSRRELEEHRGARGCSATLSIIPVLGVVC
jgi:hypothetical protein